MVLEIPTVSIVMMSVLFLMCMTSPFELTGLVTVFDLFKESTFGAIDFGVF